MSNEDAIEPRVVTILTHAIEESTGRQVELQSDTALLDSGYLDSLTTLQVFVSLQEEFGIELDVSDLTEVSFATPQSIAELIESRL